ncbi:MAG: hypothetical protein LBL93_03835 [Ruminococcus sp.]|nr:hypothetical protein [Ruminococcus sp.]
MEIAVIDYTSNLQKLAAETFSLENCSEIDSGRNVPLELAETGGGTLSLCKLQRD